MTVDIEELRAYLRPGEIMDDSYAWGEAFKEYKDLLEKDELDKEGLVSFVEILKYDTNHWGREISPDCIQIKELVFSGIPTIVVECDGMYFSKCRIVDGVKKAHGEGDFVKVSVVKSRYLVDHGIYPLGIADSIITEFLQRLKRKSVKTMDLDEFYPEFSKLYQDSNLEFDDEVLWEAVPNTMYKGTFNITVLGEQYSKRRIKEHITLYNSKKNDFVQSAVNKQKRVNAALRVLITQQMLDWVRENGGADGKHVDHIIPFKNIRDSWMQHTGSNYDFLYDLIKLEKVAGLEYAIGFNDKINKDWQDWHKLYAEYRFLEPKENLERPRLVNTLV